MVVIHLNCPFVRFILYLGFGLGHFDWLVEQNYSLKVYARARTTEPHLTFLLSSFHPNERKIDIAEIDIGLIYRHGSWLAAFALSFPPTGNVSRVKRRQPMLGLFGPDCQNGLAAALIQREGTFLRAIVVLFRGGGQCKMIIVGCGRTFVRIPPPLPFKNYISFADLDSLR